MAKVRFVLHDQKKDGRYSILLWYRCQVGGIYKKLVGEYIQKRNWSKKTQRALPSTPGAFQLNRYLDEREEQIVNCVRQIKLTGAKVSVQGITSRLSGSAMGFWAYVGAFTESPPPTVSHGTLKVYARMFNNLQELFPALEFADVNQGTVDMYIKKRQKEQVNDSTIRTEINKLPAFLSHAKRAKVISHVPELEINVQGVDDNGDVYLNEDEIRKLYGLIKAGKLDNYPGLCDFVRFFVLGTQIGVRVSDLRISPEQIYKITRKNGRTIEVLNTIAEKTGMQVIIPLTKLAKEILKHYKNQIPKFYDQHLNDAIKTAARVAELKSPVVWREKINGEIVETVYEKWKLVSSHTMRRSFATNLYKRGAPSLMIMKITGHKKESSFLKYIRISKQEAAEAISEYM